LQQILLILATCSFLSVNARVVTYQYVQDSGLCEVLTGDYWDVEMGDFYIDCGNANQGVRQGSCVGLGCLSKEFPTAIR